ncbi:P-loop containing nucleoside triphosphate hydrolase protein [Pelagophyceae sp. CCMP2097]|nr:P-loop containing nucleoside triphosphate hydrolase protein [Pelagophyceae sp. CCMP2097]
MKAHSAARLCRDGVARCCAPLAAAHELRAFAADPSSGNAAKALDVVSAAALFSSRAGVCAGLVASATRASALDIIARATRYFRDHVPTAETWAALEAAGVSRDAAARDAAALVNFADVVLDRVEGALDLCLAYFRCAAPLPDVLQAHAAADRAAALMLTRFAPRAFEALWRAHATRCLSDDALPHLQAAFSHSPGLRHESAVHDAAAAEAQNDMAVDEGESDGALVLADHAFVDVCGLALPYAARGPRPARRGGEAPLAQQFVATAASTRRNLRALGGAMARAHARPVVLRGTRACGKSVLLRELARLCGVSLIEVVVDQSIDARSLLGHHELSASGDFEWHAAPLAEAVRNGDWVLIEDVADAPVEVLALLKPLAEHRALGGVFGAQAGLFETIDAAPSFRLWATQTLDRGDDSARPFFGDAAWAAVQIEALAQLELAAVAAELCPQLPRSVIDAVLGVFTSAEGESATTDARSFFKVCRRCRNGTAFAVPPPSASYVPEAQRFAAALEAFDVIVGGSRDFDERDRACHVAAHFGVESEALLRRGALHDCGAAPPPQVLLEARTLRVGRAALAARGDGGPESTFALTPRYARLMERVAVSVANAEACLLVGEPGCGKTSIVQRLAALCGRTLRVLNLSHATDSDELLGGVRPVSVAEHARKLHADACEAFDLTFNMTIPSNVAFRGKLQDAFAGQKWGKLARGAARAVDAATDLLRKRAAPAEAAADASASPTDGKKRKRPDAPAETDDACDSLALEKRWAAIGALAHTLDVLAAQAKKGAARVSFAFVESALATAATTGEWVLLDELNLAPPDVLDRLAPLLDRRGLGSAAVHADLRIFGAMNPGGDAGKRELPPALRSRFTELFVREPDSDEDLEAIACARLGPILGAAAGRAARELPQLAVALHRSLRGLVQSSDAVLVDGAGQAPRYSLRTFCRALDAAVALWPQLRHDAYAAVRDGCELAYATQLVGDEEKTGGRSCAVAHVARSVVSPDAAAPGSKAAKQEAKHPARRPPGCGDDDVALVAHYWLRAGPRDERVDWAKESKDGEAFVLTPTAAGSLRRVARALAFGGAPILLQGPTCAGKTTLVEYVAKRLGVRCHRVNNHEHTDVAEYVGRYAPDALGGIEWRDGALTRCVRAGEWLLLDELNLAPPDVLEALNRLLDDNKELRIAETGEVLKPAPGFALFATQNPAGECRATKASYGGRKPLSRAFRDRFVEIHVDEVQPHELEAIVVASARVAPSVAKRLVDAHKSLARLRLARGRDGGVLFEGKHALCSSRDVLKWARRLRDADDGAPLRHGDALLAQRLRTPAEREIVLDAIRTAVDRTCDDRGDCCTLDDDGFRAAFLQCASARAVAPTRAMERLAALCDAALARSEPVLLVGETGGGKTTVCELLAAAHGAKLSVINCHMHSEAADFLGALRPARAGGGALFEWCDGALVAAMRRGDWVMLDELNLADDAVLERLNSVLEPKRAITLAEKGGDLDELEVVAAPGFRLLATMNPGGDHGKRELSPALRSRFTEVWCPPASARDDLVALMLAALRPAGAADSDDAENVALADAALDYAEWCSSRAKVASHEASVKALTPRDIAAWAHFVRGSAALNIFAGEDARWLALAHGCCVVCLDGLALSNGGASPESICAARHACAAALLEVAAKHAPEETVARMAAALAWELDGPRPALDVASSDAVAGYGAAPFFVSVGDAPARGRNDFCAAAPTTSANLRRVLRALALPRAVLLEGEPGVGKSALVGALAQSASRVLYRVNLSEHTDLADLLGADLPVSADADAPSGGDAPALFAWRDGPVLRAAKRGEWVLLDELNLAPQPVLEGLNACLDHRRELFVPELGETFKCHPDFRIFATQNPLSGGAGRRGLPRSFVDRFTRVDVTALNLADFCAIAAARFAKVAEHDVAAGAALAMDLRARRVFGADADVNVRDLERWCELSVANYSSRPADAARALFAARCRDGAQAAALREAFESHFGAAADGACAELYGFSSAAAWPAVTLADDYLRIGAATLSRAAFSVDTSARDSASSSVLSSRTDYWRKARRDFDQSPRLLRASEAVCNAVRHRWPCVVVGARGKAVVRAVASAVGATLWELQLSPATDVVELLGGYEQSDAASLGARAAAARTQLLVEARALVASDAGFFAALDALDASDSTDTLRRALHLLRASAAATGRFEAAAAAAERAVVAQERAALRAASADEGTPPPFEWLDGAVVAAAERGAWLVLDDANLCAPSVLDRLNSLLEPRGVMALTESGNATRVVTPHPAFRVFLAIDADRGELSRAMRNRCVEVFCEEEDEDNAPRRRHRGAAQAFADEADALRVPSKRVDDWGYAVSATWSYRILDDLRFLAAAAAARQSLVSGKAEAGPRLALEEAALTADERSYVARGLCGDAAKLEWALGRKAAWKCATALLVGRVSAAQAYDEVVVNGGGALLASFRGAVAAGSASSAFEALQAELRRLGRNVEVVCGGDAHDLELMQAEAASLLDEVVCDANRFGFASTLSCAWNDKASFKTAAKLVHLVSVATRADSPQCGDAPAVQGLDAFVEAAFAILVEGAVKGADAAPLALLEALLEARDALARCDVTDAPSLAVRCRIVQKATVALSAALAASAPLKAKAVRAAKAKVDKGIARIVERLPRDSLQRTNVPRTQRLHISLCTPEAQRTDPRRRSSLFDAGFLPAVPSEPRSPRGALRAPAVQEQPLLAGPLVIAGLEVTVRANRYGSDTFHLGALEVGVLAAAAGLGQNRVRRRAAPPGGLGRVPARPGRRGGVARGANRGARRRALRAPRRLRGRGDEHVRRRRAAAGHVGRPRRARFGGDGGRARGVGAGDAGPVARGPPRRRRRRRRRGCGEAAG